jgi:hypothetical protein
LRLSQYAALSGNSEAQHRPSLVLLDDNRALSLRHAPHEEISTLAVGRTCAVAFAR